MDFFFHFSHRRVDPESALVYQIARLTELIATADIPPSVACILVHGFMTALHKADRATQAVNAAAGDGDPLRAINSGSTFLKQGLKCIYLMTVHKSFQLVKKRIGVCQYGLGCRGGPECMCRVARSHVAMGFAVNTQDAIRLSPA
jgi:hypothetical protein